MTAYRNTLCAVASALFTLSIVSYASSPWMSAPAADAPLTVTAATL